MIRLAWLLLVIGLASCDETERDETRAELQQLRLEVEYLRAQVGASQTPPGTPLPATAMAWLYRSPCDEQSGVVCHGAGVRLVPAFHDGQRIGLKVGALSACLLGRGLQVSRFGETVKLAPAAP